MVNATLAGLRGVNLQISMDDMCIASSSWEDYIVMLSKVFKVVIESNLKLNCSKCVLGATNVLFLGHIISEHGVKQDPAKTKALLELPKPKYVSGVRRILGMLGYYRQIISNFAALSEPLTKLLKKSQPFKWETIEENAFRQLLSRLAEDVTLSQFNQCDPIALKTDACKSGIAANLLQRQNNEWRLITCCSRRLNEHETNYGISELEALAIVYAVEKLRSFLLGKHFQILTDHSVLSALSNKTPTSSRLRRWAQILQEFDFTVVYSRANLQNDVDCLSRAPVDPPDEFVERRLFYVAAPVNQHDWSNNYTDEQSQIYLTASTNKKDGFELKNNIIYCKEKLYVPPNKRQDVVKEAHNGSAACHGGAKTTESRLKDLWWPDKSAYIKDFVAGCPACQSRKIERLKAAGTMYSFENFDANEVVAIDFPITETLNRNQHIILGIDCFTRYTFAKAVPDTSSASFITFLLEYVGAFGIPSKVLTDNAKCFTSQHVKEIERTLGGKHNFSSPQHSQGNSLAERALQTLQDRLNLVLKQHSLAEDHWDMVFSPMAILSMNTSIDKTIKYTPYEMRFGNVHPIVGECGESKGRTAMDVHVKLLEPP